MPSGGLLIILCGLPGSGKTTLARFLASGMDDVQVVSSDALRSQGSGRTWLRMAEAVRAGLSAGRTVVVDATNYSVAHRNGHACIAAEMDLPHFTVFLDARIPTLLKRNRERMESIPEAAIRHLAGLFETPSGDDTVRINTEELQPPHAFEAVRRKMAEIGGQGLAESTILSPEDLNKDKEGP